MKAISGLSRSYLTKGFTLVEVMVVVALIIILAAIGTTAYVQQQNRATSEKGKGIAEVIITGADKYYAANGEYPLSSSLTTVDSAATAFSAPADSLQGNGFTFYGCPGSACNTSVTSRFYYVTRLAQTTTGASANTIGPCTVTLNSNTSDPALNGASMFFVAYYDPFSGSWIYKKGETGPGSISISGTGCAFS
jgi:prepilin-type N-terminal cleavage/methylation domain-containing protein